MPVASTRAMRYSAGARRQVAIRVCVTAELLLGGRIPVAVGPVARGESYG